MDILMLTLLVLATWRVTHLITDDEVPFGKLRGWLERKYRTYGWGMGCTYCMSVWTGAASAGFALWRDWAPREWDVFLMLWGATATLVILITEVKEALSAVGE